MGRENNAYINNFESFYQKLSLPNFNLIKNHFLLPTISLLHESMCSVPSEEWKKFHVHNGIF